MIIYCLGILTLAYKVQLDDNYSALNDPKIISQSVGRN